MTSFKIVSVKINEEFNGTLADAIGRAIAINEEYQPSFGVQVEDSEDNEVFSTEAE